MLEMLGEALKVLLVNVLYAANAAYVEARASRIEELRDAWNSMYDDDDDDDSYDTSIAVVEAEAPLCGGKCYTCRMRWSAAN